MIRIWRIEISPINPASFFAFERSERQRTNDSRQSRNAKLLALAALGALASCTQYREPQANCFSFLASTAATAQDCHFAPLGAPEGDVEV
ncbi:MULTISPECIES: hypothetical protein [Rhodobacterales]|uniref:Uncharacterized protein n=1 Tax=Neptunicoccus cionae TaxID=2035344 RepID=A0A916VT25_9RHOB|nr:MULTISPECIES: hypothetical protein [Paracoccaceae]KMK64568.1 hypothetical protein IMCC21224_13103 [Puniceibacterium sp. IMCC21224]GGA32922.1 hypothetical protein GCM10011498_37660 [Amylibacter cionae]